MKKEKKSLFRRGCQCIKEIFDCFDPPRSMILKVNEKNIMKTIQKIKNKNFQVKVALPPQK